MGQHALLCPTTTGGTPPAHAGIASEQAVALLASHCVPTGSHRNAGQQSSNAVPIQSCVPGGHAGAGVAGQALADWQIAWQLKWAQQSDE